MIELLTERIEDYDFLLRSSKKYRIGNCSDVTLTYRLNSISISRSNDLKQLLPENFLQKNYKNIESITKAEIDRYVLNKTTTRAMENFDKAQLLFKAALLYKENKQQFKTIFSMISAFSTSKYFYLRCKNMLAVRAIKLIKR